MLPRKSGSAHWWTNEGPKWIFVALWHVVNILAFIFTFLQYYTEARYFYLRSILGLGLPFARGAAQCLNVNCALIMFPVCRNLTTWMRNCLARRRKLRPLARLIDRGLRFHKTCGYLICLFTLVHVTAHIFNVENFVSAWDPASPKFSNTTRGLVSALAPLNDSVVIVTSPFTIPALEAAKLLAGVSGLVMIVVLVLMLASATSHHRHHFFERFWMMHHLFAVFLLAFIVHGMQGVIRYQSNVEQHDPLTCQHLYTLWGSKLAPQCPMPTFTRAKPVSWCFVVVPLAVYLVERVFRWVRSFRQVKILQVVLHPSHVVELQLQQDGFTARPGEYIFIKCHHISRWEWHPFTLTSAPDEDFFSVHIRCAGDWTTALYSLMEKAQQNGGPWPRLSVDGPFGTATEHVRQFPVTVLIGTGIGVTPFAAILKDIWHRRTVLEGNRLRRVYFYWICPDFTYFEWFATLLQDLEKWAAEESRPDFITFQIFLTRGWDGAQTKDIIENEFQERDLWTGLVQKTHFGRPNFDSILQKLAQTHPNDKVGVFFCGPKILSAEIHKLCNQYSSSHQDQVKFYYHKENF